MYSHNLNEVKVYFIIIQRFNAEPSCENSFGPCAMSISRLTPILNKLTSPALLHFPGIFRIELIGKWINKRPLAQSWCTRHATVSRLYLSCRPGCSKSGGERCFVLYFINNHDEPNDRAFIQRGLPFIHLYLLLWRSIAPCPVWVLGNCL